MKKLISIILLLFACSTLGAQVRFTPSSISQACEVAATEGKLIMVDLYADWCGPCKIVDRKVFSDSEVGRYVNSRFIALKFDIDDEPGSSVVRRYGIRSVPRILIFSADGELLTDFSPARKPKEFLDKLKEMTISPI